jgi:DnaJ-class molecular chaperone
MKKIEYYRKMLGVTQAVDLKELKSIYRNLMKEYHPDKFQDNEDEKKAAEEKSKKIIEAYHFLVSIAPETIAETLDQYNQTINGASIDNFNYKNELLRIDFSDGHSYEYFGVPKSIYSKLVNAPAQSRFIRRHVCNEFTYRSVSKIVATA